MAKKAASTAAAVAATSAPSLEGINLMAGGLLASIAMATVNNSFLYIDHTEEATKLVDAGLISVDTSNVNEHNQAAATATEKGINAMNTQTAPATNAQPAGSAPATSAPAKPTFLRMTIAKPVRKRTGTTGQTIYPFDELAAPQGDSVDAFFVPATAEKQKPWESLQSAVSAATRRYATKTGEKTITLAKPDKQGRTTQVRAVYNYTRKFSVSEGDATDPNTNQTVHGAWVARTQ